MVATESLKGNYLNPGIKLVAPPFFIYSLEIKEANEKGREASIYHENIIKSNGVSMMMVSGISLPPSAYQGTPGMMRPRNGYETANP